MPIYHIKISGSAHGIEADSPEEAIKKIRRYADIYCSFNPREVGRDCDALGWDLPKDEEMRQRVLRTRS